MGDDEKENWRSSRHPQKLAAMSRGPRGQSSRQKHRLTVKDLGDILSSTLVSEAGSQSNLELSSVLTSLASLLWRSALHLCLPRLEVCTGHLPPSIHMGSGIQTLRLNTESSRWL